MKKLVLVVFVALLAVGLAAPPAGAASVPLGAELNANLKDFSSVWDTGTGDPVAVGEAIDPGDEQRAIFTVSSLFFGDLGPGDPTGTDFITAGAQYNAYTGSSLTGMLYDVNYRAAASESTGLTTYWTAGTRYVAGTDWVDTYTKDFSAVDGLSGYGGIVVIYEDDTVDWDPSTTGGDSAWSAGTGPALGAALPTMSDEYPTVADISSATAIAAGDASPFLILAMTPIPGGIAAANPGRFTGLGASDVFVEEEFTLAVPGTSSGGATGFAFGNVIGGAFATSVRPNTFGPGRDIRFDFDVEFVKDKSEAYGWLGESDDPVGIATLPEPATMSLLGLGLVGLIAGATRKRKSA